MMNLRDNLNPMTRSMISTSVSSTECRISPVCRGYARLVLLGAGLVEHRQQLRRLVGQRLQIHHCIRPVSIIRVEDEVSVEVSGVESRQRKTISVPSQRSFGGSHGGSGSCGEQVVKEMISDVSRYSTSLVTDSDRNVVFSLRHQNLNLWQLPGRLSMCFNCGSHRVLEEFK